MDHGGRLYCTIHSDPSASRVQQSVPFSQRKGVSAQRLRGCSGTTSVHRASLLPLSCVRVS
eukprot:6212474-Pleurochrysis_carterae.AAC.1